MFKSINEEALCSFFSYKNEIFDFKSRSRKICQFHKFSVFHDFHKLSLSVITGFNCIEYERHIASCLRFLGVPVHYPQ